MSEISNEINECPICFETDEQLHSFFECECHLICSECYKKMTNKKCPECRAARDVRAERIRAERLRLERIRAIIEKSNYKKPFW
jgi:hypothetical protein